jgi:signal transduction histidine kinase
MVAVPLLAAEAIRTHRSNLGLVSERLELVERARDQQAERRAEQERLRIARELHDVVAHTLTEINVQAGSAAERTEPSAARDTLERIERTSHGALAELRAILGVLRGADADEQPRAPSPGLSDIPELVKRVHDTEMDVTLETIGEPPADVSDSSSLAAYRIVQESLTNARRHAPGAPVRINLQFDSSSLLLAIESGTGTSPNGSASAAGAGITGMRQRATAIGGRIQAGPTPRGFRVEAELPYEPRG